MEGFAMNSLGKKIPSDNGMICPLALALVLLWPSPAARAITCNGGVVKASLVVNSNSNFTTTATSFEPIPGAAVSVPTGAIADTFTVIFSAEAAGTGGGSVQVVAQRSIDGGAFVNMPPGPVTFHSGNAA